MYLNFQRLDEILSTRNISKPQNREIKYALSQIPAEFEIIFFLIFDQSMTYSKIRVSVTYLITITINLLCADTCLLYFILLSL